MLYDHINGNFTAHLIALYCSSFCPVIEYSISLPDSILFLHKPVKKGSFL